MLVTLTQATSGDIYYDGLDIKENLRQVRPKIGIIFQDSMLDDALSVKDNLYVQAGLYNHICQEHIDEVIALTSLTLTSLTLISESIILFFTTLGLLLVSVIFLKINKKTCNNVTLVY